MIDGQAKTLFLAFFCVVAIYQIFPQATKIGEKIIRIKKLKIIQGL